jgi:putative DNA primase/helicase
LVLFGRGSNGKTRLMETVIRLLGSGLIYAGRVEELNQDRFAVGSLLGKLLFLDDDVRAGVKLPDGDLKRISERKQLTGEAKFRDKFNFTCRVVPVLLCNNVPAISDLSPGMLRRLQVIPFEMRFAGKAADPRLFDRIWATEMPGVLNRAIEGWQRLQARGLTFQTRVDLTTAKQQWLVRANPLKAFLAEMCMQQTLGRTLVLELYQAYTEWAKGAGITLTQQRLAFRHNLENQGFKCVHTNRGQQVIGLSLRRNPLT